MKPFDVIEVQGCNEGAPCDQGTRLYVVRVRASVKDRMERALWSMLMAALNTSYPEFRKEAEALNA